MLIRLKYHLLILFLIGTSCVRVAEMRFDNENLFNALKDSTKTSDELAKSISLKEYNNGVIDDFNKGVGSNWWGSSKIRLSSQSNALVIDANDVGLSYDRFGHRFKTFCDFTKHNTLRIRARSVGKTVPLLRIDLKDANGYVTNHLDAKSRILINNDYIDYYYTYEGRFEQGWPFRHAVDKTKISELEIFINPGGDNYTGRIIIDEITVFEPNKEDGNSANETSLVSVEKNGKEDITYWWSNNPKYSIKYSEKENGISILSRGCGKNYESFGRGFSSIDLSQNPVIRVRAKVFSKVSPDLRVDLIDANGNATNGDAILKSIPNDGEFHDYYYDFRNRLYQGWPQTLKVDPRKVSELMFFLNPGQVNFEGEIIISEIQVMKNYTTSGPAKLPKIDRDYSRVELSSNWWVIGNESLNYHDGIIKIGNLSASEVKMGTGFDKIDLSLYDELSLLTNVSDSSLSVKLYDVLGNQTGEVFPSSSKSISQNLYQNNYKILKGVNQFDYSKVSGIVLSYYPSKSKTLINELEIKEVNFLNQVNNIK